MAKASSNFEKGIMLLNPNSHDISIANHRSDIDSSVICFVHSKGSLTRSSGVIIFALGIIYISMKVCKIGKFVKGKDMRRPNIAPFPSSPIIKCTKVSLQYSQFPSLSLEETCYTKIINVNTINRNSLSK